MRIDDVFRDDGNGSQMAVGKSEAHGFGLQKKVLWGGSSRLLTEKGKRTVSGNPVSVYLSAHIYAHTRWPPARVMDDGLGPFVVLRRLERNGTRNGMRYRGGGWS